jgi:hypothetical protein
MAKPIEKRRCASCRKVFTPSPRAREQRFCSARPCQNNRRRIWQREKLRKDADYRENAELARQKRAESNPDYWKIYRQEHPDYTERNVQQQRVRDEERRGKVGKKGPMRGKQPELATETPSTGASPVKSATCAPTDAGDDTHESEAASMAAPPLKSGTYELRATDGDALANGDAIRVEIVLVSKT